MLDGTGASSDLHGRCAAASKHYRLAWVIDIRQSISSDQPQHAPETCVEDIESESASEPADTTSQADIAWDHTLERVCIQSKVMKQKCHRQRKKKGAKGTSI